MEREPAPPQGALGEPEQLALPAAALARLLHLALRTEPGSQWWDGFLCAHGYPTWATSGRWRLVVQDGALVRDLVRDGALVRDLVRDGEEAERAE